MTSPWTRSIPVPFPPTPPTPGLRHNRPRLLPCHTDGEEDGEEDYAPVKGDAGARFVEGAFDLSTCTAVVARREDSWQTIVNNTMPPGAWPRLTSEERLTIQRWMDNGAPAPCNPVPVAARRNGGAR